MKLIDIGLIYFPSSRSIAYVDQFIKRGISPKELIIMSNKGFDFTGLKVEDELYNYSDTYFQIQQHAYQNFIEFGTKVIEIETKDINDENLINTLVKGCCKFYVFSGGGIIKKESFEKIYDKKIIHIHPGLIPEFRGSTCFYYSFLENKQLYATAFFMEEELDSGEMITASSFNINVKIESKQELFFDYIVDSYIRASVLGDVLDIFIKENDIISKKSFLETDKQAYYVAHPLLRHLVLSQINSNFNSKLKVGIFRSDD